MEEVWMKEVAPETEETEDFRRVALRGEGEGAEYCAAVGSGLAGRRWSSGGVSGGVRLMGRPWRSLRVMGLSLMFLPFGIYYLTSLINCWGSWEKGRGPINNGAEGAPKERKPRLRQKSSRRSSVRSLERGRLLLEEGLGSERRRGEVTRLNAELVLGLLQVLAHVFVAQLLGNL